MNNSNVIDLIVENLKKELEPTLESTDIITTSSTLIFKVPSNEDIVFKALMKSLNDPRLSSYFISKNTTDVPDTLVHLKNRITYTPSSSTPSDLFINSKESIK